MPSMKELQDLLEALDAEGGLAIGGGDESANLDDLFEDSYFHPILHNNVKQDTLEISSITTTTATSSTDNTSQETDTTPTNISFETLALPQECAWGDDHEVFSSQILVRPGYAAVVAAITQASISSSTTSPQTIFMATGPSGIGKSCLAYFLVHKLFAAGHNVVISDPMFTNALIENQYYSSYSPHLEKHPAIFQAISSTSPSGTNNKKKPTWWICDDGFLPIKGTQCHVLVTGTTPINVDRDVETIRKKNKLALPVQFQIPKWSLDEIKAGLLVSLSSSASSKDTPQMTKDQEAVLETLFKKFKGNPKKTFTWVKENWTGSTQSTTTKPKAKTNKPKRS
ncbi:hypothetical protein BGX33_005631 [Mortierella sp. NVP41]|nr:hypothetical protein BGX33_005631 [Mortierella sp. NVP41]